MGCYREFLLNILFFVCVFLLKRDVFICFVSRALRAATERRSGGGGRLALDPIAALQGDKKARLQTGGGFPLLWWILSPSAPE